MNCSKILVWGLYCFTYISSAFAEGPTDCEVYLQTSQNSETTLSNKTILSLAEKAQVRKYFNDTVLSLEKMRGPNGLVADKIGLKRADDGKNTVIEVLNQNTSPTNIALDLLVQIERVRLESAGQLTASPSVQTQALENINKVLGTLEKLRHHTESGLFFSWYSTNINLNVADESVSAVDNIHLALSLWTLRETFSNTPTGTRAGKLFASMDFSIYYDPATGLVHGNLKKTNNQWIREAYHFSNLGSESRSVYSLGSALGLFKIIPESMSQGFNQRSISALRATVSHTQDGPILQLWDGGAFQLLLPDLLANEAKLSPELNRIFSNYARFTVSSGKSKKLPLPAGFSASNMGIDGKGRFQNIPDYNGKAGHPELVSVDNRDIHNPEYRAHWDRVVTPHAILLSSNHDTSMILNELAKAEQLGRGQAFSLYESGLGWMDGLHVKGEYKGTVVPVQLSLDQGMIALSTARLLSNDSQTASARALSKNQNVSAILQAFYRALGKKLAPLLIHPTTQSEP